MRLAFQIALVVLIVFGATAAGAYNLLAPAGVMQKYFGVQMNALDPAIQLAVTVQIRLLSGMWVAAGLVLLACVRRFERHTGVIRLVLLGMALGSVGELASNLTLGGETMPAVLKSVIQLVIYTIMELWRMHLVRKPVNGR
jgi:hypothetical protein